MGRRFGRDGHKAPHGASAVVTVPRQGAGRDMDDKVDKRKEGAVERIHDAITRQSYRVDADAVADAIVKRLLEGRTVK
jgi:anti-sigma28 factor (negative regulator of flagellin synthesis)